MANRRSNSLSVNTFEQEVTKVSNTKGLDSDWAQKYFDCCAQSQTRISMGFGTGRLREESQGLLFRSCKLTWPLRISHGPTICPWVTEDDW